MFPSTSLPSTLHLRVHLLPRQMTSNLGELRSAAPTSRSPELTLSEPSLEGLRLDLDYQWAPSGGVWSALESAHGRPRKHSMCVSATSRDFRGWHRVVALLGHAHMQSLISWAALEVPPRPVWRITQEHRAGIKIILH